MLKVLASFALFLGAANADVYMSNVRGSNNRLDEANRDRTNGDRLFDSQNNNRGGSNVGAVTGEKFYQGSIIPLEWTNQHSCGISTEAGQPNNDCNVVWQYMCDARLRDGTSTNTIPDNNNNCANNNCDTDQKYGRHESYNYYKLCSMTQRDLRLYTANQNVQGRAGNGANAVAGIEDAGAIYTRQNPNGARRGYECPEERDYYPYWRAAPWVDIAYLTNTPQRCEAIVRESQNVKARGECTVPAATMTAKINTKGWIPNNAKDCAANGYTWNANANPPNGAQAPQCIQSFATRDNHLGNTDGTTADIAGYNSMYNWTIPNDVDGRNCAIRIRYNISSSENGSPKVDVKDQTIGAYGFASANSIMTSIDYTMNQKAPGQAQNNKQPSKLDVWSQYGLTAAAKGQNNRDYAMRNNPQIQIFAAAEVGTTNTPRFQLAINTNQFYRTFQDRSFAISLGVPRPANIPAAVPIHNINVRGKRGNIVQTYPGTEYDMAPNRLTIRTNDYVQFQWTGANTNPANNAGEGTAGQDRSNVVALRPRDANVKEAGVLDNKMSSVTHGAWGRSYPTTNINKDNFLGWPKDTLNRLAVNGIKNSFIDSGAQKVGVAAAGVWNYMSTRNNNFTNRSQKSAIVASNTYLSTSSMGYSGGHVFSGANYLKVGPGVLAKQHKVTFTGGPSVDEWESDWVNVEVYAEGQNAAHEFHLREAQEDTIVLHMSYTPSPFTKPALYRTIDGETAALNGEFDHEQGVMLTTVNHGGMYIIKSHLNIPLIIGLGASTLFILGAVVAGSVAAFKKQSKSA